MAHIYFYDFFTTKHSSQDLWFLQGNL